MLWHGFRPSGDYTAVRVDLSLSASAQRPLCYGHHESPPQLHRHAQVRETSRKGARSPGATERFLDFFDGHTVGLIVRLVILVVVSLKGKQLVSVALPDHGNVNAPFHPGF